MPFNFNVSPLNFFQKRTSYRTRRKFNKVNKFSKNEKILFFCFKGSIK